MSLNQVHQFLRSHYVESQFYSHVSMLHPRGRFCVERDGMERFWKLYCDLIYENKDSEVIIGVAEKQDDFSPVMVDVDIKMVEKDVSNFDSTIYSERHITQIIEIYQSILKYMLNDVEDKDLTCILLEKPMYRIIKNNVTFVKNGFHLHFPYILLSTVDHEVHLIPRAKEAITDMEIFADIGIKDSASVIDKAVCTVPWMLYGSRKSEDQQPYKVTKCYNHELNEITLEEAFEEYELLDFFNSRVNFKSNIEYYLPRLLTTIPLNRKSFSTKPGLASILRENQTSNKEPADSDDEEEKDAKFKSLSLSQTLELVKKLLPLLSLKRAQDRNDWMTVGWCLYSISDGCSEGFDAWIDFSRRDSTKFDEAKCIYEWSKMVKRDLTIGTLRIYG